MNLNFQDTGKKAVPDRKKRISLGAAIEIPPGVHYKVMKNDLGQILLDPVKEVPAYEAWIYENPEVIAAIRLGIAQAEAGQVVSIDLGPEEDDDEDE